MWLYEPKAHTRLPHSQDDISAHTELQDFVADAPLRPMEIDDVAARRVAATLA